MKILLVDDEQLQLLRLQKAVGDALSEEVEILCFSNPLEAWEKCKGETIDLAFLDIEMPGCNGIQLAKKLKGANPMVNIVFVTAYDHYAVDAYRLHASGYVNKPVNAQKVQAELDNLRHPIALPSSKKLQVKCFGNFAVFHEGKPLRFAYKKSMELLAYLIDREGSPVNTAELNAVLWEEDHPSYLRNLIADLQSTLSSIGASEIFIKRHNECAINVVLIDCDAYEYKHGNPDAVRAYRGEYMAQFPWAQFHADE